MGIGASKKLKVNYEKPRGSEDPTAAAKRWLECLTFEALPEDGRTAFIEYAEKQCSRNDTRRLKFWYKSPEGEDDLGSFLTEYLVEEPLSDVGELSRNKVVPKTVIESATKIDGAIKIMKDSMRKDLNSCFKEFRKHLEDKITPKS